MNLLGIGLILIVALLVLGPKRMQSLLHYLGELARKALAIRSQLERELKAKRSSQTEDDKK